MTEFEESNDRIPIVEKVQTEISKAIVGYENKVRDFLICLISNGHILLEGVPGIAKTTLTKTFAKAIGIAYNRIQFTQDVLPADITGYYFYNQKSKEFEFRKGPIFTELLLADEINRAPPKTQSALLEAMQETQVTVEGENLSLSDIFIVIATKNPIETEGVYPLPEAQIDRFMMKISMGYPSEEEEKRILDLKKKYSNDNNINNVINKEEILEMREKVEDVFIHESIIEYIRDITRMTRNIDEIELGLSPRGGIHLMLTSKANAFLSDRSYVIPDDVKDMAHKVIDHRLILSPEAEIEGIDIYDITENILSSIEIPKEYFN